MNVCGSLLLIHSSGWGRGGGSEGGGDWEEVLRAKTDGNEEMRGTEQVKQRKIEEVVIGSRRDTLRKGSV